MNAYEDEISEAENKINDYEAECKTLGDAVNRLKISRNRFRDMVNEVQSKNAEEIAELQRKHAEEIAALNNRAEQTNDKNLEAWTELNNKYVESQLKVAKMEPDYNSYQAQRQSLVEWVKVGEKRAFHVQQAQEMSVVQAEHLRSFDSHAKTPEFIAMTTGKGLSRRQRREQRYQQKTGAGACSAGGTSAISHPPAPSAGRAHPPPQPACPAHPSQASGSQLVHSRDNSLGIGADLFPSVNLARDILPMNERILGS
jgi:hypothetical protein